MATYDLICLECGRPFEVFVPGFLKDEDRQCPHCGAPHFAFIDGPILDALRAAGFEEPCIHEPSVDHLPA